MNKTIQSRITFVLVLSIALVAMIGSTSLYYISKISFDVNAIIKRDLQAERSAERIKSYILDLKKDERVYMFYLRSGEGSIDIGNTIAHLETAVENHLKLAIIPQNEERLKKLLQLTQTVRELIDTIENNRDSLSAQQMRSHGKALSSLTKEMNEMTNQILDSRYQQVSQSSQAIDLLISKAHRNMIFFIVVCVVGGIILIAIAPSRVTAPFKKYIAAIKEIEDLKFDTRLPIRGDDEVSQLGRVINRMIDRFQTFDKIKFKRIQFERSKQRVLADMLDLGVMMMAIEGEILFMNAQLSRLLEMETEDYKSKDFHKVGIPNDLKDMIEEVLHKKEKANSRMMIFNYNHSGNEDEQRIVEVLVDVGLVRNYQGDVVNVIITFEDITNAVGESVFKRISLTDQQLTI